MPSACPSLLPAPVSSLPLAPTSTPGPQIAFWVGASSLPLRTCLGPVWALSLLLRGLSLHELIPSLRLTADVRSVQCAGRVVGNRPQPGFATFQLVGRPEGSPFHLGPTVLSRDGVTLLGGPGRLPEETRWWRRCCASLVLLGQCTPPGASVWPEEGTRAMAGRRTEDAARWAKGSRNVVSGSWCRVGI